MVRSPVYLKAHVFIEASGLGVLLIYGKPLNPIVFNPVLEKSFSQPSAPLLRGEEQHLQGPVFDPHKRRGPPRPVLSDDQVLNPAQRLRDILERFRTAGILLPACRRSASERRESSCPPAGWQEASDIHPMCQPENTLVYKQA